TTLPHEDVVARREGARREPVVQVSGFATLVDADTGEVGAEVPLHLPADIRREGRPTTASTLHHVAGLARDRATLHADFRRGVTLDVARLEFFLVESLALDVARLELFFLDRFALDVTGLELF